MADALKAQGLADEGLAMLDDALRLVEETGEPYCEAEIHRLRGGLLRAGRDGGLVPRLQAFEKARPGIDVVLEATTGLAPAPRRRLSGFPGRNRG